MLKLEILTEWRNTDLEICAVLNPLPKIEEASAWPEGYFESVVGKWEGDFERPDQGIAEKRDPL